MRVGILTFHLGPNHGGYLQAYCLCEYIKSMGHTVEIINYKNASHHDHETFRPWIYRRPFKLYHAWVKERVFQKAYKDLDLSEFTTSVDEVRWNDYDAVVFGSDVVWDYTWPWLGHDHVYFGDFGGSYQGKRVAYAPSTGTTPPETEIPDWVSEGLASFDGICARDEATATLVQRATGSRPQLVVDPTWLDMSYREIKVEKKKHLVIYAFEVSDQEREAIQAYASKHGLEIVALGYYLPWADRNDMKLGPLEWPRVMEEAEVVVAGTFHGTLYAIKTQSQFVTLFNERIKYRVQKPLEASGLEKRMLRRPEELESLMHEKIDYQQVMQQLSPYVEASRNYLSGHLGTS